MQKKREFQQKTKTRKSFPRISFWAIVVILLLLIAAALLSLDAKIRPVANSIAAYHCRTHAIHAMQTEISNAMRTLPEEYDALYTVQYAANGQIQSITANTRLLNSLQYDLEAKINQTLSTQSHTAIEIPIGTLSGVQLFSGRGPSVDVWAIPVAVTESHAESEFTTVGINQTKLQVNLVFSAKMKAIMANESTEIEAISKVCVAEILIVGEIPDVYLGGGTFQS